MTTSAEQVHDMNNERPAREPHPEMTATEDRLAEEILAVLADAKGGLTENEILAVVTLRRERALFAALEELLLEGVIGATREASPDRVAMSGDFAFWALTDEEVAARRKNSDRPLDSLVTTTDLHND